MLKLTAKTKSVFYCICIKVLATLGSCQIESEVREHPEYSGSSSITPNRTSQKTPAPSPPPVSTQAPKTSTSSASTVSTSPPPTSQPRQASPSASTSANSTNRTPLTADHYVWQRDEFKYRGEYSNRCLFPSSDHHVQGTMLDELFALRDEINRWYIFRSEVVDVDPRKFVRTVNSFDSYYDIMTNNDSYIQKLRSLIPNEFGELKHEAYEIKSLKEVSQEVAARRNPVYTFGIEWKIISESTPRDYRVTYTEMNTVYSETRDALGKVKRGDKLVKVNDMDFVGNTNEPSVETMIDALSPMETGSTIRLTFIDRDSRLEKKVILKSYEKKLNSMNENKIIATSSGNVGYLHIGKSGLMVHQYHQNIEKLLQSQVEDVIVDFRYFNEEEYRWTDTRPEASFAYMIVGEENAQRNSWDEYVFRLKGEFEPGNEKTFVSIGDNVVFNTLCPILFDETTGDWICWFEDAGLSWKLDDFLTLMRSWRLKSFDSVNLDRVFVLVSNDTCGKAELFINALRGIGVEVILIGDSTCGNPYFIAGVENCGIVVKLIESRYANRRIFSAYEDGFIAANSKQKRGVKVPGCYVKDDLSKPLGDKEEPLLAAALQYRNDKTCPPVP